MQLRMLTVILASVLAACGAESPQEAAAAGIQIAVEPPTAFVGMSETVALAAMVTGTADTGVTWSADCGSVTSTGLYTAPGQEGLCHVIATSNAAQDVQARAEVVVGAAAGSAGGTGWAATCAAEPLPAATVYACDCQAGADAGCVPGDDANPGTSPGAPKRTWTAIKAAFNSLPAGGAVALCKGGRWNVGTSVFTPANANCASASCTLRDYSTAWGKTKPTLATSGSNDIFRFYNSAVGFRFLNLQLLNTDRLTPSGRGNGMRTLATGMRKSEVCNMTFDGFSMGMLLEMNTGAPSPEIHIRGNRFVNNCADAIQGYLNNSDIDGNYFDNNGHNICLAYAMESSTGAADGWPYGPTTHTVYLSGSINPIMNVRFINNEVYRNAVYQGYVQGSPIKFKSAGTNVTIENNLIDMTPPHPTVVGTVTAISMDNDGNTAKAGFTRPVLRRNRIIGGPGRKLALSSVSNAVVESNTIYSIGPANSEEAIAISHKTPESMPSLAVIRNNTIYVEGTAPSSWVGIRTASSSSASGQILTGNSVTLTGGGGSCYRVDQPAKMAFMDNNHCAGATNFATTGASQYGLAGWRSATRLDASSVVSSAAGLFVNAPADLTPAAGSPLAGAGSTAAICTVGGVAGQACSSPFAIGSPAWSPTDLAVTRGPDPSIGAFEP